VTEENENNAFQNKLNNQFVKLLTIQELQKIILNTQIESESNNKIIESLTNQNELLMSVTDKQHTETAKQTNIQLELQSQLIEKEKEIYDLKKKIESILIAKLNKNNDIYWHDLAKLIEKDETIKISGFENELCLRDI
jgi:hypothetical protein